jgi:hypothetical protein
MQSRRRLPWLIAFGIFTAKRNPAGTDCAQRA